MKCGNQDQGNSVDEEDYLKFNEDQRNIVFKQKDQPVQDVVL